MSFRIPFQLLAKLWILMVATSHAATCSAEIIFTIPNQTIAPGKTGSIDLLISSNANDELDRFEYRVTITPLGSPQGALTFVAPLFDGTDADYVYGTPSFGFLAGIDSAGLEAFGGDETANQDFGFPTNTFLGPTLDATPRLLARLNLSHDNAFGAGDSFQVSLVNTDARFLTDLTFSFDTFLESSTALNFSSSPGTITIGPTAVPEPSTFVLALLGIGACVVGRRQRRAS
ncbi:MAG: PEP-CTERM sorting domain-containing protein [Planctomycetota bacterium]